MEFNELRDKPKQELELILKDEREKLRNLRFGLSANQIKNVREVRKVKRAIARINTLLRLKI